MPGISLFNILLNLDTTLTLFTKKTLNVVDTSTLLIHMYTLPRPKLPALLDHIFAGYLFLCLIDAHGKTSLLGFHQVPLDPGQIELYFKLSNRILSKFKILLVLYSCE